MTKKKYIAKKAKRNKTLHLENCLEQYRRQEKNNKNA